MAECFCELQFVPKRSNSNVDLRFLRGTLFAGVFAFGLVLVSGFSLFWSGVKGNHKEHPNGAISVCVKIGAPK